MPQNKPERPFTGPLAGVKVVEIGSIGPGPFCAMHLADLGADVIRVDRVTGAALVGPNRDFRAELLNRGRRSIAVDLKHPEGADVVLSLVERADALIEGFRPGVWPEMKKVFADAVRRRTRDEWMAAAEGLNPCVAPVLAPGEAPTHPHNAARRAFVEIDGLVQPAPAPRFSRTTVTVDRRPPLPGEHTTEALTSWGIPAARVASWITSGAARELTGR